MSLEVFRSSQADQFGPRKLTREENDEFAKQLLLEFYWRLRNPPPLPRDTITSLYTEGRTTKDGILFLRHPPERKRCPGAVQVSRFLLLPWHIRDHIYEYVFPDEEPVNDVDPVLARWPWDEACAAAAAEAEIAGAGAAKGGNLGGSGRIPEYEIRWLLPSKNKLVDSRKRRSRNGAGLTYWRWKEPKAARSPLANYGALSEHAFPFDALFERPEKVAGSWQACTAAARRREISRWERRARRAPNMTLDLGPGRAALLLVCRQTHAEAVRFVYGHASFNFGTRKLFGAFLKRLTPPAYESLRCVWIGHKTYGSPKDDRMERFKRAHDRKWEETLKEIADKLTGLEHLHIQLNVHDNPPGLFLNAVWAKPLLVLSRLRRGGAAGGSLRNLRIALWIAHDNVYNNWKLWAATVRVRRAVLGPWCEDGEPPPDRYQ